VAIPCPYLPPARQKLSWRELNALRDDQGEKLYLLCLEYGQQLWLSDLPARALLAVDRALYCDVSAESDCLKKYPLPFAAIGWFSASDPLTNLLVMPEYTINIWPIELKVNVHYRKNGVPGLLGLWFV
jgi:hypothetical protein